MSTVFILSQYKFSLEDVKNIAIHVLAMRCNESIIFREVRCKGGYANVLLTNSANSTKMVEVSFIAPINVCPCIKDQEN